MAGLDFCSKHNMVAYLEKNDGNTEFHQIMDFPNNSSIHFALTVSPIVSTLFVEQFWTSAKSRIVNNISYIDAIVARKPVTISEASIRSDLLFDDADGIDTLNNQAIFNTIQLMGPSESQPIPSPTHPTKDQPESQPNPSPRPSSPNPITDFNPEGFGGNYGGQSSSDRSLSGNEDGLTLQSVYDLCISLYTQVTAQAAEIKDLKARIKQFLVKTNQIFQKQTVFGKDKSNPLIVDSLLNTIRFSIHLVVYNEELAIPEQTATGKGTSNPLMDGGLPKTTKPT
ncbi:hypothetical protein Tco_0752725 [Tanacetum coccineum]|uniref:Uncharacterized protein n=1 Tax=Tanacetum coccineum TaxID=301880 RepID=A0ABQ4Z7M9_9ASTR